MHAFLTSDVKIAPGVDTLEIRPETSIGIDDVRQIQHFLSRKPTQTDHNTVIIYQAHLLTIPAQNALLKTLEEPPGNSLIYLVTDMPDQLLATILSRVDRQPSSPKNAPSPAELKKFQQLLTQLLSTGVGERLKLIEAQAFTRESALVFLDQVEYLIHQDLAQVRVYERVVQTRKYLKANCQVKLCLTQLALDLT
ncbi:MAG: hypothetical protein Q7S31_02260 [bacterium]|nr:hypothetical protein [bacterium]